MLQEINKIKEKLWNFIGITVDASNTNTKYPKNAKDI